MGDGSRSSMLFLVEVKYRGNDNQANDNQDFLCELDIVAIICMFSCFEDWNDTWVFILLVFWRTS